ncbi:hypothetical protein D9M69_727100 [compost metagenome]
MREADGGQHHVDPAGAIDYRLRMPFDGCLIQDIDGVELCLSARRSNCLGGAAQGFGCTSDQKDIGAFAGKGSRRCAADCAAAAINDGHLVLKQHFKLP